MKIRKIKNNSPSLSSEWGVRKTEIAREFPAQSVFLSLSSDSQNPADGPQLWDTGRDCSCFQKSGPYSGQQLWPSWGFSEVLHSPMTEWVQSSVGKPGRGHILGNHCLVPCLATIGGHPVSMLSLLSDRVGTLICHFNENETPALQPFSS